MHTWGLCKTTRLGVPSSLASCAYLPVCHHRRYMRLDVVVWGGRAGTRFWGCSCCCRWQEPPPRGR
jgi:hypothetical protein